jgi:superfamily II DNA or RNA helicase
MQLRPYQKAAADGAFREWEEHQSTLIVMPTGAGKTRVASEIIRRFYPKRSIFLAHRFELVQQAKTQIETATGISCDIEMADLVAANDLFSKSPVIISSIQTQCAGKNGGRMTRFKPEDFGLVVVDEGHHGTAETYRRVLDYYKQNPAIKILGITATPDRTDEEALGQIFESVAFDYELTDAINEGWLVPIEQQIVQIRSLDFSHVKTTAGDLNGADLAAVMEDENNLQGMVGASIEIIGQRKSIVFTSSVRHAELCCNIFNRHRAGMAGWVCGETGKDERRLILKDFGESKIQVLCNVGVATEGFDCPDVECVIMGRPTKSRALYTQMAGRGTRPLTGTLDELHSDYERKEAIAVSKKPSVLILDFAGNSGKHKLITTADILGGKYSEEAIEAAVKKATESGEAKKIEELLELSEQEIRDRIEKARLLEEAARAKVLAKVKYTTQTVNPFDVWDLKPHKEKGWDHGKVLSMKQRGILVKIGIDPDQVGYAGGKQLLNEQFRRWKNNLATMKQCRALKKFGYDTKDMTMKEALALLDQIAKNGWRKPEPVPA